MNNPRLYLIECTCANGAFIISDITDSPAVSIMSLARRCAPLSHVTICPFYPTL